MRTNNPDFISEESDDAHNQTIRLSSDEQLASWKALDDLPTLNPGQNQLSDIMRGPNWAKQDKFNGSRTLWVADPRQREPKQI